MRCATGDFCGCVRSDACPGSDLCPPTGERPTYKELKASAAYGDGFQDGYHAEAKWASAIFSLFSRDDACWRLFSVCFFLVFTLKVKGHARTDDKSSYICGCFHWICEQWIYPVTLVKTQRELYEHHSSNKQLQNTGCLPGLQFKSLKHWQEGDTLFICGRTQNKEIHFCVCVFPIFVVHFQAALNDRYFTYNEEPALPWSSERNHLFKSPSLISWI